MKKFIVISAVLLISALGEARVQQQAVCKSNSNESLIVSTYLLMGKGTLILQTASGKSTNLPIVDESAFFDENFKAPRAIIELENNSNKLLAFQATVDGGSKNLIMMGNFNGQSTKLVLFSKTAGKTIGIKSDEFNCSLLK